MKFSLLIGGAAGYVLGTRAGHERYEQIVRISRRLAGSQTVQSAAGVLRAQVTQVTRELRGAVGGAPAPSRTPAASRNGVRAH